MNYKDLVRFIDARERHRVAKEAGTPVRRPDFYISTYRFCNVKRNDDRVTKWIHKWAFEEMDWRDHTHLWFALTVARLFNNEPTLENISGQILPFADRGMRKTLHGRKELGFKNFNAAYIVSTNGQPIEKVDYVIDHVLAPLWKARISIARDIAAVDKLATVHARLIREKGLGSFMAAQVLADLKYAQPDKWKDFHTFAASGPGSKRGLNRVMGRNPWAPIDEAKFRDELALVREKVNYTRKYESLTAQDIQNCLCEFDKYERVRLGEGVPKQLYKPRRD